MSPRGETNEVPMEKVLGIGGVFFRARDPKALKSWYEQHLGVTVTPDNYDDPPSS